MCVNRLTSRQDTFVRHLPFLSELLKMTPPTSHGLFFKTGVILKGWAACDTP